MGLRASRSKRPAGALPPLRARGASGARSTHSRERPPSRVRSRLARDRRGRGRAAAAHGAATGPLRSCPCGRSRALPGAARAHRRPSTHARSHRRRYARFFLVRRALRACDGARRVRRRRRQSAVGAQLAHRLARQADGVRSLRAVPAREWRRRVSPARAPCRSRRRAAWCRC